MYKYPMPIDKNYFSLLQMSPQIHSMGDSLYSYLKIKIHSNLELDKIKKINIIGKFDRSNGVSNNEKDGKLFNFMRPTINLCGDEVELRCFPGIDYVFHFSNVLSSYSYLMNYKIDINCMLPSEEICWKELCNSSLKNIPKVDTVIMGYVEGLDFLSYDKEWLGEGNFLYKRINTKSGKAILLGCKHTYWGEIAGRIIVFLSMLGVKRVIYSGKLGTLDSQCIPNESIATGNMSRLPNGELVIWDNLFESYTSPLINKGAHITVPSVLQETKWWVEQTKNEFMFVDPEIGHMAYAAQQNNIQYSYLHIVSDNLSRKYSYDLSNERKIEVISKRCELMKTIGEAIRQL